MLRIVNDKKLHFIGGVTIGTVFSLAVSPFAGVIAAVLIGIAKELRDKLTGAGNTWRVTNNSGEDASYASGPIGSSGATIRG